MDHVGGFRPDPLLDRVVGLQEVVHRRLTLSGRQATFLLAFLPALEPVDGLLAGGVFAVRVGTLHRWEVVGVVVVIDTRHLPGVGELEGVLGGGVRPGFPRQAGTVKREAAPTILGGARHHGFHEDVLVEPLIPGGEQVAHVDRGGLTHLGGHQFQCLDDVLVAATAQGRVEQHLVAGGRQAVAGGDQGGGVAEREVHLGLTAALLASLLVVKLARVFGAKRLPLGTIPESPIVAVVTGVFQVATGVTAVGLLLHRLSATRCRRGVDVDRALGRGDVHRVLGLLDLLGELDRLQRLGERVDDLLVLGGLLVDHLHDRLVGRVQ